MKKSNDLCELLTVQRSVEPSAGHRGTTTVSFGLPLNGLVVFSRLVSRQREIRRVGLFFLAVPMGTTSNFFCKHLCPEIHRPSIIHITEALPGSYRLIFLPSRMNGVYMFNLAWEKNDLKL